MAPPSLIGDIGGGALYLAVGVLAAIMNARSTGIGQVVDAAIVDGSAHMMNLMLSLRALGQVVEERGKSILDGPHWYATYRCSDGGFVSLGSNLNFTVCFWIRWDWLARSFSLTLGTKRCGQA
jgi:acetyl-CoA hydrolase